MPCAAGSDQAEAEHWGQPGAYGGYSAQGEAVFLAFADTSEDGPYGALSLADG